MNVAISASEDNALRTQAAGEEAEFRRLRRLAAAKAAPVDLWARSPSPEPLPELLEPTGGGDQDGLGAHLLAGGAPDAPAGPPPAPPPGPTAGDASASESESDAEAAAAELERFQAFVRRIESERAAAVAAMAAEAEANRAVGPQPAPAPVQAIAAPGSYGKALLPGEGDAIAAFVQSGERIPRRGEIGLTSAEISGYEDLGYVMSGSRHTRMNAIRIRKENQVYSAEEKAALAMINFEEKKVKEAQVMQEMQTLVKHKLDQAHAHAQPRGGGA